MHEIIPSRQQAGLPLYQKTPGFNTSHGRPKTPWTGATIENKRPKKLIAKNTHKTLAKPKPLT
jgi:hypothetical protein